MGSWLYRTYLCRRAVRENIMLTREARRAMQPVARRGRQRHQRKES